MCINRRNNLKAVNLLKVIDKFLKYLKTDRNTFLTYILTLISTYLVIDRIVEMLLMIFTGMGVSYWGPISYTLALACPVFAFLFSCSSKYASSEKIKVTLFDVYLIALYILIVSMFTQFTNLMGWMLFLSVPNVSFIVTNFFSLIRPAFSAVALYLPLTTFYPVIKWLLQTVHDTKTIYESIYDYKGISLADKSASWGPYTCELIFGKDSVEGTTVKIAEEKRFYPTLVCGVSGSGKTSLLFEPTIAKDIDKKFFFREVSKEMGFTALKTGIATLNCPYDNKYLNANFRLDMISPKENKVNVYNTYMKKMIISGSGDNYIYKNLGITYISPDIESINRIQKVLDGHNIKANILDPNNSLSIGLNPFVFEDPLQTAVAISTVLKGLYVSNNQDMELAYRENAANQAVENLSILLKEMYPKLHDGNLPNLEDLLDCLTNFELVEKLCELMKRNEELANKYSALLKYFERNFYRNAPNKKDTEQFVVHATSQLDSLLRYTGVKNILCNRTNNINFDKTLKNGEVTLVCTRRGDLGPNIHKAFGLFCILMMQYSILKRPGTESTRLPHFLYIDEFADFVGSATDPIFTLYRKYRVSSVVSIQNVGQLGTKENKHRQIILSNCSNKFVFGNNTPEDNEWWSSELGDEKKWLFGQSYDTEKGKYSPTLSGIAYRPATKYAPGKVQSLKFKQTFYKLRNLGGKSDVGILNLSFLSASDSAKKPIKEYNFDKYNENGSAKISDENDSSNKKYNLKHYHFNDDTSDEEVDPIKTDNTGSSFLFNNDDAIVFNLKKPKK